MGQAQAAETFEEACPVPGLFCLWKANTRFSMCHSNRFHRQWFDSENCWERKNYIFWKPCFTLGWNYSACAELALASYPGIIELDCFDKALKPSFKQIAFCPRYWASRMGNVMHVSKLVADLHLPWN